MSAVRSAAQKQLSQYIQFLQVYVGNDVLADLLARDQKHIDWEQRKLTHNQSKTAGPFTEPEPEAVKDPRLHTYRAHITAALEHKQPGELGRGMNNLRLVLDEKTRALDPAVFKGFYDVLLDINNSKSFQAYHAKLKVDMDSMRDNDVSVKALTDFQAKTLDPVSAKRMQDLAGNIMLFACQQLLDDKGEVHPAIVALKYFRLEEINQQWGAELKKHIVRMLVSAFCGDVVISAFSDPKMAPAGSPPVVGDLGYVNQALSRILFVGDILSPYAQECVNIYVECCRQVRALEAIDTVKAHVIADIKASENARLRINYWNDISTYLSLHTHLSVKAESLQAAIAQAIMQVSEELLEQLEAQQTGKGGASSQPNPAAAATTAPGGVSASSTPGGGKSVKDLKVGDGKSTGSPSKSPASGGGSAFFGSAVASTPTAHSVVLPAIEAVSHRVSSIHSDFKEMSFIDDPKGIIARKLLEELLVYINSHNLTTDEMHKRNEFIVEDEKSRKSHALQIKVSILRSLLNGLQELNAAPVRSLRQVLEDWKKAPVVGGPYHYTRNFLSGRTDCKSNYDVLGIHTKVRPMMLTTTDAQDPIVKALKNLPAQPVLLQVRTVPRPFFLPKLQIPDHDSFNPDYGVSFDGKAEESPFKPGKRN